MTPSQLTGRTLLALAVIVGFAFVCGQVARRLRQPAVLGELLGGILLGPSLLGAVAPTISHQLFATPVVAVLRPLSQIGVVLFMFVVGLELDHDALRGQGHRAVVISHASILLPFATGAGLALWPHPRVAPGTQRLPFVLFVGAAMSVTAFPVLARILQESGLNRRPVGALAIACAAVDDVTAWCILAGVVAIVTPGGAWAALRTVGLTIGLGAALWWVVRPLLARFDEPPLAAAVAFALACAWASEAIGIHAIFGAFLAGAVMPRRGGGRLVLVDRLDAVTSTMLLPVFFVVSGLSTRIDLLTSAYLWGLTGLVVLVAMAGKLGGSALAARAMGESWRDSWTIGALMNTRGLTEIVILTVGLDAHLLSVSMFTIMVVMALATSLMTLPLLARIRPDLRAATGRRRAAGRSGPAVEG